MSLAFSNRAYIEVAGVDFASGAKSFLASLASGTPGSNIALQFDRLDGPAIGSLPMGDTGV